MFIYSKTGLPENPRWRDAIGICNDWLDAKLGMFGPEKVSVFLMNQPVFAAKTLIEECPNWTEESVTAVLLGPARSVFLEPDVEGEARKTFGDRTVDLVLAMIDPTEGADPKMDRDMARIFLVEGLATLNDRFMLTHIDKHHQTRWKMLKDLERDFVSYKGWDAGLDQIFEETLVKARASLEALDRLNISKKPKPPTI